MQRDQLQLLLTAALCGALGPLACGGSTALDPDSTDGSAVGGNDASGGSASGGGGATTGGTSNGGTSSGGASFGGSGGFVGGGGAAGGCAPVVLTGACDEAVTYPCESEATLAKRVANGECAVLCEPFGVRQSCYVRGGTNTVSCALCAIGRRPNDLLDEPADADCADESPVATALAEMARIEAASVHAFRRLGRVLGRLGASRELLSRVRKAARDEVTHARRTRQLAEARGGKRRRVVVQRGADPTPFELALENAVEGCVHETLGVAFLEHQRRFAADPELRAHAAAICEDELDHAALSWELVPFFDAHLSDAERELLQQAQVAALERAALELDEVPAAARSALGLPSTAVARRLVQALRGQLYAA